MDRRAYVIGCIVIGLFIVCTQTSILAHIMAFFILGIIPMTDYVLPAWVALLGYPLIIFYALYWLTAQPMFIGGMPKSRRTQRSKTKRYNAERPKAKKPSHARRRPRTAV